MATQRAYERRILRPMSTIGDKYLLGSGRTDHDRLRVISEIHDGRTRELLRKAGFVAGHRFVEFSCGLGYVTRWAASEGAHATGIDLNEDHLTVAAELAHEAGLKTAEFRSANIYEPGLEPDWCQTKGSGLFGGTPRPFVGEGSGLRDCPMLIIRTTLLANTRDSGTGHSALSL